MKRLIAAILILIILLSMAVSVSAEPQLPTVVFEGTTYYCANTKAQFTALVNYAADNLLEELPIYNEPGKVEYDSSWTNDVRNFCDYESYRELKFLDYNVNTVSAYCDPKPIFDEQNCFVEMTDKAYGKIEIQYDDNAQEIEKAEAIIKDVLAQVSAKTQVEKIEYIVNYICSVTKAGSTQMPDGGYDLINGVYDVLTGYHTNVVCTSYAVTVQKFFEQAEIESVMIHNSNHIWNMVCLDGVWYGIDATFGDVGSTMSSEYLLMGYDRLKGFDDPEQTPVATFKSLHKLADKSYYAALAEATSVTAVPTVESKPATVPTTAPSTSKPTVPDTESKPISDSKPTTTTASATAPSASKPTTTVPDTESKPISDSKPTTTTVPDTESKPTASATAPSASKPITTVPDTESKPISDSEPTTATAPDTESEPVTDNNPTSSTTASQETTAGETPTTPQVNKFEINLEENTVVSTDIFKTAKENGEDISFVGKGYSWKFAAKDIPDEILSESFNAEVYIGEAMPQEAITAIETATKNEADKVYPFSFSYHGKLPGVADITIEVDPELAGKTVYIYYLNDKMEPVQSGKETVADDGTLTFTTDHCSVWFLSEEQLATGSNTLLIILMVAGVLLIGLVATGTTLKIVKNKKAKK